MFGGTFFSSPLIMLGGGCVLRLNRLVGLRRPARELPRRAESSPRSISTSRQNSRPRFQAQRRTTLTHVRWLSTEDDAKKKLTDLELNITNVEQVVDEFLKKHGGAAHEHSVEFDKSGLHPFGATHEKPLSFADLEAKKGPRNELTKHLHAVIQTRGPMSLATFMNYALTHPQHGYYMKSDVFGQAGDFTTSPEISQMFGELLGAWCAQMWIHLGRPNKLHIVELGPGRGTLSNDLLNGTKDMKAFFKAAQLHFVEVSPHLRRLQAQKFGLIYPAVIDPQAVSQIQVPTGWNEELANLNQDGAKATSFQVNRPQASEQDYLPDVSLQSVAGTNISWHKRFEDVPVVEGEPMLVIAQEFFDALPVYHLEKTKKGWRERLVDLDDSPDTADWFRTTLAPAPTPACHLIERADQDLKVGSGVEKCVEGMKVSQLIADRLLQVGGAAVFIDYGHDENRSYTIRGIKDHKFVSIYKEVGAVDLSANVDFAALARAALTPAPHRPAEAQLQQLRLFGSIPQSEFLTSLGIYSRMAKLLRKSTKEEDAEALIAAFNRLTDKRQMGSTYKVLGMFSNPKLTPEGFEGVEEISYDNLKEHLGQPLL